MLFQMRYVIGIVVEAEDENEAGGKARKVMTAHIENDWWNEHLLDIEVEKMGKLESD